MWFVFFASQALSLKLVQPDYSEFDIHAHMTAMNGLTEGAARSTQDAATEKVRLEDVVASLHTQLAAAELEKDAAARQAAEAAAAGAGGAVVPLKPGEFGPITPGDPVRVIAQSVSEDELKAALGAYVDDKVNSTQKFVVDVATAAGVKVARAAANAAAQDAAAVAANKLVDVACSFVVRTSGPAAEAGAIAASVGAHPDDAAEAGELAKEATKGVLEACVKEAREVSEDAQKAALAKAEEDAVAEATVASRAAAERESHPAVEEAAQHQMQHLLLKGIPAFRKQAMEEAMAAAAAKIATEPQFGSGVDEVNFHAAEIAKVGEAAARLVEGAERVASNAAYATLVNDIPDRFRAALVPHRNHFDYTAESTAAALLANMTAAADAAAAAAALGAAAGGNATNATTSTATTTTTTTMTITTTWTAAVTTSTTTAF